MTWQQLSLPIGVVLGMLTIGASLMTAARAWQQHLADDAHRDRQIHQLQTATASEHPEYSAMLDWIGDIDR